MKRLLVIATLALASCAHEGKRTAPAVSPLATTANEMTPISSARTPADSNSPAYPAEYEEYYVGMIPDADDPNFAYRPGELIVQTRPARFRFDDRDGIVPAFDRGPVTFARMANDHPDPTDAEFAAMIARSRRTIAALTEENERLLAQSRPKLAGKSADPGPMTAGDITELSRKQKDGPAQAPDLGEAHLNVITPNDAYVIELDPNLFIAPAAATNNPFVQLYQPPVAWREWSLQISAAVPGPKPTAIIDGEPYSVGDRYRDLTVYRVEPDTVYLRKDAFLLACPVSERSLKLRLP